jgi:hypothetical protein
VCALPESEADEKSSRNNDLFRQSSLKQLKKLEIIPNRSLVEFLENRDSREAKEASCLAGSSFEEESRSPTAPRQAVENIRRSGPARAVDFTLEKDIELQASRELSEKLTERDGSRRSSSLDIRKRSRVLFPSRARSRRSLRRPASADACSGDIETSGPEAHGNIKTAYSNDKDEGVPTIPRFLRVGAAGASSCLPGAAGILNSRRRSHSSC